MTESLNMPLAMLRTRGEAGDWHSQAVVVADPADDKKALFIPKLLPCGECGACRRALVSSCVAIRNWVIDSATGPPTDLPDRFTYHFDTAHIAPRNAVWADVVAPFLEAMGRCGLGPGDTSFWIGTNPAALVAATLAAGRGSKALLIGPRYLEEGLRTLGPSGSEGLPRFAAWNELDAAALSLAEESPGHFAERHVFVLSEDPMAWSAAVHLLAPGTTLVGFGGLPAIAGLPPDARVVTLGSTYNPDLVPEALAALGNGSLLVAACEQLAQSGAYSVWPESVLA